MTRGGFSTSAASFIFDWKTMAATNFRIGVDIGGTFTDIVLIDQEGIVHTAKTVSTTEAYERGILEALQQLLGDTGRMASDCSEVAHGTTVATNAIIERKGALTGLLTTEGFRDVLELRRIRIPTQYDLTWQKPTPLVERYLRLEVAERMNHAGEVLRSLEPDSVQQALKKFKKHGVESVAVSLLNSYANPEHEQTIREIVSAEYPDIHISLSSDLLPEMREYERTSTAVINAYVMPVVKQYLESLGGGLEKQGFHSPLLMMQSNGGIMTAEVAREEPIHIIESGPAAGVIASHHLASRMGVSNVISMDIGGTTAKASLIEDGEPTYSPEYEVGGGFSQANRLSRGGGYLLRTPTLDIAEIGAGGGSIVWVDQGGALQVGPKSAGANPGPACYSLGGEEPTLADCCLMLGYLDKEGIAGGTLSLDQERAENALKSKVADQLGMDLIELAFGVVRIAVSNMTRAIRSVSTERGKDPRDFTLFAFGGNGGLFAASVERELELSQVIIPPSSGIFSAFGLLYSDLEHHFTQTLLGRTDELDPIQVETQWVKLEDEAAALLAREGYALEHSRLQKRGELRYYGQTHELSIPWPEHASGREALEKAAAAFEDEHERTYGHRGHDSLVELVNLHLVATGVPTSPRFPATLRFPEFQKAKTGEREIYFGPEAGWKSTRLLNRDDLGEEPHAGPILLQEFDATILVPPDFLVARDGWYNIILQPS